MAFSLKLELDFNYNVLVTNTETQEQIEVTLDFIQKITKNSLTMLIQYQYYELIIDAEKSWKAIKKVKPGLEATIIKELELEELQEIENIKSSVRRQIIEEETARQQRWDKIAANKKAQRHNRLSMAI